MGDYLGMLERFLEAENVDALDAITVEELAELDPMDFRERAREFFDPQNKAYDPGEDPGVTTLRADALRREATEAAVRELNEDYAGTGKGFVKQPRSLDTIQLTEGGEFTGKTIERGEVSIITVDFGDYQMEQVRDDKGRIVTARKV